MENDTHDTMTLFPDTFSLWLAHTQGEIYFDINSYITYNAGRNVLIGAENSLTLAFRFCNDQGMLIYQDADDGFFAAGINSGRVFLEWKTSQDLIEVG